jgi:hypothetical protein
MQKIQVYYLVEAATGRRCRYYRTQTGARIAQRLRNRHKGFEQVQERIILDSGLEQELCRDKDGNIVLATYSIIEDWIDLNLDE